VAQNSEPVSIVEEPVEVPGSSLEPIIRPVNREPEEEKTQRNIFLESYTNFGSDDF